MRWALWTAEGVSKTYAAFYLRRYNIRVIRMRAKAPAARLGATLLGFAVAQASFGSAAWAQLVPLVGAVSAPVGGVFASVGSANLAATAPPAAALQPIPSLLVSAPSVAPPVPALATGVESAAAAPKPSVPASPAVALRQTAARLAETGGARAPLDELYGSTSKSSADGEPRVAAWPLRFSIRGVARDAARKLVDGVLHRDPFQGRAPPPRIPFRRLALTAARHLSSPVEALVALHRRYGDAAYAETPSGQRIFLLAHPEAVRAVLVGTDGVNGGAPFQKSEAGIGALSQVAGRDSLFLGLGDRWRSRRRLAQPFFQPKAVTAPPSHERIVVLVDGSLGKLAERARAAGSAGLGVRVSDEMSAVTLDVILGVLFHAEIGHGELVERVVPAFQDVTRMIAYESLNPTQIRISDWPNVLPVQARLRAAYETLDRFAGRILAEGRARRAPRGDFLDALLSATAGKGGKPLSDAEIKHEILSMLLAGHETTASTLAWALHALSRAPESRARLMAEIDQAGGALPDLSRSKPFPFLNQVIRETLRLFGPVYVLFRKAVRDVELPAGDKTIFVPKGSEIVLPLFVTHRREEQWGAAKTGYAAEAFAPERFDPRNVAERGLDKAGLESLPFGSGARVCLGQALSLLETQLVLVRFLQRFRLAPLHPERPAGVVSNMTIRLADGFPATLTLR